MRTRILILCAGAMCAMAQTPPAGQTAIDRARRVGVGDAERRLTLEQALEMALKNNLAIEVERTQVATAAEAVKGAKGVFDTVVLWTPSIEDRRTPQSNTLFAPDGKLKERNANVGMGVRQRTPWSGVTLNVTLDNSRQTTTNPFSALNPYYSTRLTMAASAPLWRGRAIDRERAEIKIRMKAAEQSKADFETRVVEVVTQAQAAYWDLVAAREDATVAEDGVRLAREQLERTKRFIENGTLAPVELAASEAELQRRIDTYVSAIGLMTVAENALKLIVTPGRTDELWGRKVIPVDRRPLETPATDVAAGVRSALERRPELRSLAMMKAQAAVQKGLASDAKKPLVTLTGAYVLSGLAGAVSTAPSPFASIQGASTARINELSVLAGLAPLPPAAVGGVPASLKGGYGASLSNLFGGDFPTVTAGVQVEWNRRNRSAEAALAQAGLMERRLALVEKQVEQGIEVEVRNALQGLDTARQRIEAAQASERAALEKLESEIRLFQTGESTNFLVLTRQNELLDSRRRAVGATLLLNRAVAQAQKALGTALTAHHITLD